MSSRKYVFVFSRFQSDLNTYLEKNSTRKLSNSIDNVVSPSTISRISTGRSKVVATDILCMMCEQMGTIPSDYFDRVLL